MSNPYEPYPGSQPSPYGEPAPYGQPYGFATQEHPQGTTVLILGILGFLVGVTAPFAWYIGHKAMKEIRTTGARYANEQQLNIGRILGMIVTLLYVGFFVVMAIFLIIVAVGVTAQS